MPTFHKKKRNEKNVSRRCTPLTNQRQNRSAVGAAASGRSGRRGMSSSTSPRTVAAAGPSMLPQRVEAKQGGSAGPARKLVIKPLKKAPKLPDDFEQRTWGKLLAAVHAVHGKQAVAHSLEELYRAVQDMCNNGMASTVYERLQAECQRHIEGRLDGLLGQTPDTLAFLNLVHGAWNDHCEQMHTLRSIFLYLDRTYVMQTVHDRLRDRVRDRVGVNQG